MSIIGNPIMIGGGGKNISSIIIITGLESTDTITCTKDGKSYTATWDSTAMHWKIVGLPLGTFTVTATNGTKTKTETVLIDIAGVYEIEISLKLWLYKDGDECEDVTGGWYIDHTWDNSSQSINWAKNDSFLSFYADSEDVRAMIRTVNPISVSTFSVLKFEVYSKISISHMYNSISQSVFTGPSYSTFVQLKSNLIRNATIDSTEIVTIDISDLDNTAYIGAICNRYTGIVEHRIFKVWLE